MSRNPPNASTDLGEWFPIAAGIVAAGVCWAVTETQGPILATREQANYAQAAFKLLEGMGYSNCHGEKVNAIPPGYSIALAAVFSLGLSVIESIRVLGAASAALFAAATADILRRCLGSKALVLAGLLFLIFNPVVMRWQASGTSDAFHAGLVMTSFALLLGFMDTRQRWRLALAAAVVAFAMLVRFVGVTAAGAVFVVLLVPIDGRHLKEQVRTAFTFAIAAVTPLAAFVLYNKFAAGTFGGHAATKGYPLGEPVYRSFEELSRWMLNLLGPFTRDAVPEAARTYGLVAACGIFLMWAVLVSWRRMKRSEAARAWLFPTFVFFYFLTVLAVSSQMPLDTFSGRYLLPVLAPLLVFSLIIIERSLPANQPRAKWVGGAFVAVFLGLTIVPVRSTVALVTGDRVFGFNQLATPQVRSSAFIGDIHRAIESDTVIGADRRAVNFLFYHFDRCPPLTNAAAEPGAEQRRKILVKIDGPAIDSGNLGLSAPKLSHSGTPARQAAGTRPIGRLIVSE